MNTFCFVSRLSSDGLLVFDQVQHLHFLCQFELTSFQLKEINVQNRTKNPTQSFLLKYSA